MPVTYVSTGDDPAMASCHDTCNLLTTASRIKRAGRQLNSAPPRAPKNDAAHLRPPDDRLAALGASFSVADPLACSLPAFPAAIGGALALRLRA